jgi:hypothetical protein
MVLAAFAFAASVHAQENVPDPDGYRTYNYRAPVPATLAGARVLTTAEAEAIWRARHQCFHRCAAARAETEARYGAISRGSTSPEASGCLTPATENWLRRRKNI